MTEPLTWKHPMDSWSTHDPETAKRTHYRYAYGRGTLSELLDYLAEEVGPNFDANAITLSPGTVIWETDPTPEDMESLRSINEASARRGREGRYRTYLKFKDEFENQSVDDLAHLKDEHERPKPATGHATGSIKTRV